MCGSARRGPHPCSSAPSLSARLSSFCCLSFYLGALFSFELAVLSSSVMLIGLQHVVSGVPFWAPGPHSREDSSPETQTTQGSAQFSALLPIFIETQCLASSRPQGRVLAAGGPRVWVLSCPRGWETPCLGADLSRCVPPSPRFSCPSTEETTEAVPARTA